MSLRAALAGGSGRQDLPRERHLWRSLLETGAGKLQPEPVSLLRTLGITPQISFLIASGLSSSGQIRGSPWRHVILGKAALESADPEFESSL